MSGGGGGGGGEQGSVLLSVTKPVSMGTAARGP